MSAPRFENWPLRLDAVIESARHRPFEWGAHDCCSFAARTVRCITGRDVFEEFTSTHGTYTDERGALRALAAAGGVAAIASAALGEPIPVTQAQRGDVMMVALPAGGAPGGALTAGAPVAGAPAEMDGEDAATRAATRRPSLAVCVGTRCVAPGPLGLAWLPLREATCAWRV